MTLLIQQVRHQMHVSFFRGALSPALPNRVTTVVNAHAEPQFIIWMARRWPADHSEFRSEIANCAAIGMRFALATSEHHTIALHARKHLNSVEPDVLQ